jgi:hypothetical protein
MCSFLADSRAKKAINRFMWLKIHWKHKNIWNINSQSSNALIFFQKKCFDDSDNVIIIFQHPRLIALFKMFDPTGVRLARACQLTSSAWRPLYHKYYYLFVNLSDFCRDGCQPCIDLLVARCERP